MTWIYLDDSFAEHPKFEAAGGDASWLWVCALGYVQRNLTGGLVPRARISKLTDRRKPLQLAERLVEARLFDRDGDDFRIHNYEKWNRSAIEKAEKRKERARVAANARWHPDTPGIAPGNGHASAEQCSAMPPVRARAGNPSPPLPITKGSSSSSTVVSGVAEDDDVWKEARRRLKLTPSAVSDEAAWLRTAVRNLLDEGWAPPLLAPPSIPFCGECSNGFLLDAEKNEAHPCPCQSVLAVAS